MLSNEDSLLTTQEAANLLKVSSSTIRRWTDDGTLKCFRVGKAKYRRIPMSSALELKYQFYGDNNVHTKSEQTPPKKLITKNIKAESHPAQYLMHKYWGRKAHNIVADYICKFSKKGELILDPFMGSGVTVIESLKNDREAIGIDINPMSTFIVNNSICPVDLTYFSKQYENIKNKLASKYQNLYVSKCPKCGHNGIIQTAIWENNQLVKIRLNCPNHGIQVKNPDINDIELTNTCLHIKNQREKNNTLLVPHDKIFNYVKRSGRNSIDELFSPRALIILSDLRELILEEENESIKNLLLFCFTSMLSNVSRMIPGDKEKATYKSGWVISKFWTPKIHTERNIFDCFELRYAAIYKGKKELQGINHKNAKLFTKNSSNLDFLKSNSIDYIFTDPPYGESIAYLALSHFWNAWICNDVDYESEIIIDQYRNKNIDDYTRRIKEVYKELYRVLKPEHFMSFTFNNRDLNVWKAVLDACIDAGFYLESVVLQEQAVSSGTQGINQKNTLTGDFVYTFKKSTAPQKKPTPPQDTYTFVLNRITKIINDNNGVTPTQLYELLIPEIVKKNAYCTKNHAIDLDSLLNENFDYVETTSDEKIKLGNKYKWMLKKK